MKWRDPTSDSLRDVTIYDQADARWPRTVTARSGYMHFTPDGTTLILDLSDGEVHEYVGDAHEYRRTRFTQQVVFLENAGGQLQEADSDYRTDREKSTEQMLADISGWKQNVVQYSHQLDSVSREALRHATDPPSALRNPLLKDLEGSAVRLSGQIFSQRRLINSMMIEVHKKYSIPVACVVFVLIGAPLGILARKSGIGMSLGLSLGLFLLYWAFLIAGEELADRLLINAFWAMWSANFVIGGAGLALLAGVIRERQPQDWWRSYRYRKLIREKSCEYSTAT